MLDRIFDKVTANSSVTRGLLRRYLWNPDAPILAGMAIIWVLMVVVTNPAGNFPLNDDWVYAKTVKMLLEERRLELHGFANYPGQVPWGVLCSMPFGFSFTALRIGTLLLGLIGAWAVYGLLREAGANRTVSAIGGATLAVNPVYYNLSHTYMTDVHFTSHAAVALFLFAKGLKTNSWRLIALGTLAAGITAITRQFGLVIPIAFLAAYLWKNGLGRKSLLAAIIPQAVVTITFFLCPNSTAGMTSASRFGESAASTETILHSLLNNPIDTWNGILAAVIYLGMYCLPMLVIVPWWRAFRLKACGEGDVRQMLEEANPHPREKATKHHQKEVPPQNTRRFARIASALLPVIVVTFLVSISTTLPQVVMITGEKGGNVVYNCGLGPPTLYDYYVFGHQRLPKVQPAFWRILSSLGFAAGGTMIIALAIMAVRLTITRFKTKAHGHSDTIAVFSLIGSVVLCSVVFLALRKLNHTDRYILPVIPLLLAALVGVFSSNYRIRPPGLAVSLLLLVAFAEFGIAGTHDYLSWNRARWAALDSLTLQERISPRKIDGGYEFNGWHLYSRDYKAKVGKSWWYVEADDYVVTFSPLPSTEKLRQYPYERWMPVRSTDYIYLSKMLDPWNVPVGANWQLKENSFIEKAVIGGDISANMIPIGVVEEFKGPTKRALVVIETKAGNRQAALAVVVSIDGREVLRMNRNIKQGTLEYLSISTNEGYLPRGSYRASLTVDGKHIGNLDFTVSE